MAFHFALSQDARYERIETFPANAEVVGILENSKSLAVLRILKADSTNEFRLKAGDEILTDFYFTLKPVKNEARLKGIEAGDKISVRLHGQRQRLSGQIKYTAFQYVIITRGKEEDQRENEAQ